MPATSQKQERYMNFVHAVQEGKASAKGYPKVQATAKEMKPSDVEHFMGRGHIDKSLPEHVKQADTFGDRLTALTAKDPSTLNNVVNKLQHIDQPLTTPTNLQIVNPFSNLKDPKNWGNTNALAEFKDKLTQAHGNYSDVIGQLASSFNNQKNPTLMDRWLRKSISSPVNHGFSNAVYNAMGPENNISQTASIPQLTNKHGADNMSEHPDKQEDLKMIKKMVKPEALKQKEAFDRGFFKTALYHGLDPLTAAELTKFAAGFDLQSIMNAAKANPELTGALAGGLGGAGLGYMAGDEKHKGRGALAGGLAGALGGGALGHSDWLQNLLKGQAEPTTKPEFLSFMKHPENQAVSDPSVGVGNLTGGRSMFNGPDSTTGQLANYGDLHPKLEYPTASNPIGGVDANLNSSEVENIKPTDYSKLLSNQYTGDNFAGTGGPTHELMSTLAKMPKMPETAAGKGLGDNAAAYGADAHAKAMQKYIAQLKNAKNMIGVDSQAPPSFLSEIPAGAGQAVGDATAAVKGYGNNLAEGGRMVGKGLKDAYNTVDAARAGLAQLPDKAIQGVADKMYGLPQVSNIPIPQKPR